jgi:hypothetical protein
LIADCRVNATIPEFAIRNDKEVATMFSKVYAVMGGTVAVALVVVALWGWGSAAGWVEKAERPTVALWAVRCGAIAALAAAQVLGMTFIVSLLHGQQRPGGQWLGLAAGLVCTVALVGAIALGIVSQ